MEGEAVSAGPMEGEAVSAGPMEGEAVSAQVVDVDVASVEAGTSETGQQAAAVSESPRQGVRRTGGHKCPICGQKHKIMLYVQRAKDRYIARELALLRASNPTPPMVSHLDEVDDSAVEEGIRREMEARSQLASPASRTHSERATPNVCSPSQSSSQPHSEHASLDLPPPSDSEIDTPRARPTPDRPHPSHSASESPNEPGTSGTQDVCKTPAPGRRKRSHPLPRDPASACRNCQVLSAELKVVKQLLRAEIERNDELKQLHSSKSRSDVSCFSDAYNLRLVGDFRGHIEGANPTRKGRENAKQRASHVIHFLEFMADPAIPNADLLFLSDHGRVRAFVAHLQERQFKPTTQKIYLLDAVAFLKYISNMSPPSVRLGTKRINALMVELRARLRDIGRDVVGHQLKVRRSKSDRLVDASKHNLFIEAAPEHIAAALDELEKRPTNRSALRLFFGFLAGYIIAITGHRKGVVINMTTEEVQTAEKAKDGARIIRVEQHKTQRYFGQAAVPLKSDEYAWFERYIELREYVDGGSEASTFFHSSSGGVLLKLGEYFKEAWEGIDLGVAPSFNMLRSSVATYAKRQLGSKTYKKVATFMCHDEHTAKRFYQADEPAEEILRSRYLSTLAISTYAAKKRSKESKKASRHDVESVSPSGEESKEEEVLESSSPEEPMRKKKKVSWSAEEGPRHGKTRAMESQSDSEEIERVPREAYKLRKREKTVRRRLQTQDSEVEEEPARQRGGKALKKSQRPKRLVSSSDDDGKATENASEEEEEQERQMFPKGDEGKMVASLVQQQEALGSGSEVKDALDVQAYFGGAECPSPSCDAMMPLIWFRGERRLDAQAYFEESRMSDPSQVAKDIK
ncbi:uncharacterized protein DAT39_023322, partial [Clarias magur]